MEGRPPPAALHSVYIPVRIVCKVENVNRAKTIAVMAASGVLLAGTLTTEIAAAQEQGPQAGAAKKKCKKKKCKKNDSPLYRLISGSSLTRAIPNSGSPSGTERYDFCKNGAYTFKKGDYSSGGYFFQTGYNGTWRAASSNGTTGVIQYTVLNFVSIFSDGLPAETAPSSPVAQPVTAGPFGIYFGGQLFTKGGAAC